MAVSATFPSTASVPCADGTIHESWMSQYECHDDMKKSWPDVPNYK